MQETMYIKTKMVVGSKGNMSKKAKQVKTTFNAKTQKYDRISEKAPKGQRRVGVDQEGRIIIYDDRGNVVAVRE
jgi:3-mercaptopyruvate sulfurtransferase SseA